MSLSIEAHSLCLTIRIGRWEGSAWRKAHPFRPFEDHDLWTLTTRNDHAAGFREAVLSLPLVALCWTKRTA